VEGYYLGFGVWWLICGKSISFEMYITSGSQGGWRVMGEWVGENREDRQRWKLSEKLLNFTINREMNVKMRGTFGSDVMLKWSFW
jgi:hypothetical protein